MTDDKKKGFFDQKMSRRDFLKKAGIAGAGVALGASVTGGLLQKELTDIKNEQAGHQLLPFYGKHQSGILGNHQKSCYLVVLELETTDKSEVIQLFKDWTAYSANLTQGKTVVEEPESGYLPPVDTGEALDLNPHRLSLTFGVSRTFLEKLGLSHRLMATFKDLPPFPKEQIEEQYSGGDIVIQACADDDQVAFHAVRNLIRKGRGHVTMKWSQAGFMPSGKKQETPRNLFGFKDGTANREMLDKTAEVLWYTENDWLQNGTFMVIRKIRMHLETWDRTSLNEQENTFGRHKASGAPFGETDEFAPVDLTKTDQNGEPIIPVDSHVRLARKTGMQMYRRPYSYSDGINPKTGQFESGMLFISFQKDPDQFVKVQTMLGAQDKLNEYITHIGTGLFACFGGVKEGDYLGQSLLE